MKPEVCDAIKHSGLFIADEFITATLDAYKKGEWSEGALVGYCMVPTSTHH